MTTSTPMDLFFHFSCPYSFLAWECLKRSLKESPMPVRFHLLPPASVAPATFAAPDGFVPGRWERLKKHGEDLRIPLQTPAHQPSSWEWYQQRFLQADESQKPALLSTVFQAFFVDAIDLNDLTAFKAYARSQGIEEATLAEGPASGPVDEPGPFFCPEIRFGDERLVGLVTPFHLDRFIERLSL